MKWIKRNISNLLISLTVFDKKILTPSSSDSVNSIVTNNVNSGALMYSLLK